MSLLFSHTENPPFQSNTTCLGSLKRFPLVQIGWEGFLFISNNEECVSFINVFQTDTGHNKCIHLEVAANMMVISNWGKTTSRAGKPGFETMTFIICHLEDEDDCVDDDDGDYDDDDDEAGGGARRSQDSRT